MRGRPRRALRPAARARVPAGGARPGRAHGQGARGAARRGSRSPTPSSTSRTPRCSCSASPAATSGWSPAASATASTSRAARTSTRARGSSCRPRRRSARSARRSPAPGRPCSCGATSRSTGAVAARLHERRRGLGRGAARAVHAARAPTSARCDRPACTASWTRRARGTSCGRCSSASTRCSRRRCRGHLGGPPLNGDFDLAAARRGACMDAAGVETAHLVGNSLGGYLALVLAHARPRAVGRRARARGRRRPRETLDVQERAASTAAAPRAARTPRAGARERVLTSPRAPRAERPPIAARPCDAAPLIANAREHGWPLDPTKVALPGADPAGAIEDRLLPWPAPAERYRRRARRRVDRARRRRPRAAARHPARDGSADPGFTTARMASSSGPSSSPFSR